MNANDAARFWAKVDKSGDCWIWTSARVGGYGVFTMDGRPLKAHRLAYQWTVGEIPAGMIVCHSCDNPPCVRPDHLWLGTTAENQHDKVRKGRQAKGDTTGRRRYPHLWTPEVVSYKVTPDMIREIRAKRATGMSQQAIADSIGLGQSHVSRILLGHQSLARVI